jgi:transcriptional regulator with XRE-family HTH domain
MMLGMSQTKLGDALGLTFQQVQKYERGTNRIGAGRLQQLAYILQVPVPFFFEGLPLPSETSSEEGAYVADFLATCDGLSLAKYFMRITKAKLLGALHEGRLKAFGIALPARILLQIHPPAIIWSRDSPGIPVHPNWEAISPEIWTPEAVHWEYGSVEWGYTDYCLVLVDTADLMELFPPPAPEQFEGAVRIASTLALKDTTGTGDSAVQRRVGRRPYHWEVILAEAQRFVHANGLPAKQDAFVLIMCNWCEKNLGQAPKRSTMASHLRGFYGLS